MAPRELKALRLLMDNPRGLYGSELVALSDNYLGRGTVYTLLSRLVEKGYVREIEEEPTSALQIARTRHVISGEGRKAVQEYVDEMGLLLPMALRGSV